MCVCIYIHKQLNIVQVLRGVEGRVAELTGVPMHADEMPWAVHSFMCMYIIYILAIYIFSLSLYTYIYIYVYIYIYINVYIYIYV